MILPSAATPPPTPPPKSRKGLWVALGVIGVVIIGVIVILVLSLGDDPVDPNGPTASVSVTQSTTPPPSTTPTPSDTPSADPATTAPESSPPPETTAPAVNQYQAYCDIYSSLEGEIETLARDSRKHEPDPNEPMTEPTEAERAEIQSQVIGTVTPLLADLDRVQASGPPPDISDALAGIGSEFQALLSIFQRHEPSTIGDVMAARDWAIADLGGGMTRGDQIEQQLTWVQARSLEVCG